MIQLRLTRASGAGNTFLILNLDGQIADPQKLSRLAKKVCKQPGLVATDGFLAIEQKERDFFKWYFYNSDGSSAEMCGNAARCVGEFIFTKLDTGITSFSLETSAGEIKITKIGSNKISVEMSTVQSLKKLELFTSQKTKVSGLSINTGVPHFVTNMDLSKQQCSEIRSDLVHFSEGTNVTLITAIGIKKVSAVTFERGVEDFTPACGTGAVAAAFWAKDLLGWKDQIEVQMPGGSLTVEFPLGDNSPTLIGSAELQFEEILEVESL